MRAWISSSGNVGISKYIGGGVLGCFGFLFAILGVLAIAALIYSLT